MGSRSIVFAGLFAAAYVVSTMMLSPIAFGPIQFRVGGLLVPLALINPAYGLAMALGTALSNITSPFGWYDWAVMPVVVLAVTQIAYRLRRWPPIALLGMAATMALSIAYFPLYMGGGIPWQPTALAVFVSVASLYLVGWYGIWRNVREWL
jgi:hypothetical protein